MRDLHSLITVYESKGLAISLVFLFFKLLLPPKVTFYLPETLKSRTSKSHFLTSQYSAQLSPLTSSGAKVYRRLARVSSTLSFSLCEVTTIRHSLCLSTSQGEQTRTNAWASDGKLPTNMAPVQHSWKNSILEMKCMFNITKCKTVRIPFRTKVTQLFSARKLA